MIRPLAKFSLTLSEVALLVGQHRSLDAVVLMRQVDSGPRIVADLAEVAGQSARLEPVDQRADDVGLRQVEERVEPHEPPAVESEDFAPVDINLTLFERP